MGCPLMMIRRYKLKIANYICGELVQEAPDVNATKKHMQRTINSLEGPGGPHYQVGGEVGNPCHGMPGGGIIDDLGEAATSKIFGAEAAHTSQRMAELARDAAVQSIANPNVTLDEMKRSARAVSSLLQAAIEALGS